MFICDVCKKPFETPYRYREDMNGEGFYKEFAESPCCHDSFSNAERCPMCTGYEMAEGEELCETCKEELSSELCELKNKTGLTMNDFINVVNDWCERNW